MGVRIRGGSAAPAEDKPLFESTDEPASAPKPKDEVSILPSIFHDAGDEPMEGWEPMSTAPKDRPILVACQIPSKPGLWAYYRVRWFKPPGWETEAWCVAGHRWHQLWDAMPKGWREDIGHP